MIIIDTNVVSELMRRSPAEVVRDWVQAQAGRDVYTTAVTVAEIRYGIERLPTGRRQATLRAAAVEIFSTFEDKILPFDAAAAEQYALLVNARDKMGRPIDGFDGQIAGICRSHGSDLATRNVADFEHTGVTVINPWRPAA
jgi:toxin FitB